MKLTAAIARDFLEYDRRTGLLTWKPRERRWFKTERDWRAWNTLYAGKPAFSSIDHKGYLRGTVFKRKYLAHRVIWLLVTGSWPSGEVDHRNRNPRDNTWVNLRDVTKSQNQRNAKLSNANKTSVTGVQWHKGARKWRAYITAEKVRTHLGSFACFGMAVRALRSAERAHGFDASHGKPE